jgi:hypothetical protein
LSTRHTENSTFCVNSSIDPTSGGGGDDDDDGDADDDDDCGVRGDEAPNFDADAGERGFSTGDNSASTRT